MPAQAPLLSRLRNLTRLDLKLSGADSTLDVAGWTALSALRTLSLHNSQGRYGRSAAKHLPSRALDSLVSAWAGSLVCLSLYGISVGSTR